MSTTKDSRPAGPASNDPYVIDGHAVQDPPTRFLGRLKFLGPGMITSAAVVGSGELLTATTLGAQVGFLLLWLVLVSTFVKVWVQLELARWAISSGRPAIMGYDEVPPRLGRRGWMSYLSLLLFLQFLIGQAGVISATAFAFSTLLPIGGDPLAPLSIGVWVAIIAASAIAIQVTNRYRVIEGVSTVLVVIVVVFAISMVFLLQTTELAFSLGQIGDQIGLPTTLGAIGIALAMFGLTGVGAGEITSYTYWCVEKGYAQWAGPRQDTPEWRERARGWISVMKVDAWVSWVIYTVSTAAFYVLGAAVLHPLGLEPEGREVMTTLANTFSATVGPAGAVIFLAGAGLALYKTMLANVPLQARQITNTLAVFGAFDWLDRRRRDQWMLTVMILLPIAWGTLGTVVSSPLLLVVIGGVLNAIYLIGVAVSTVHLSRVQTDPGVRDGAGYRIMLWVSAVTIVAAGVVGVIDLLAG